MFHPSRSHTTPTFAQIFHHSSPSSLVCSAPLLRPLVFLFVLSSFLCPLLAIKNAALQAGWSATSSEVICNGTFDDTTLQDSIASWDTLPPLYLWLSDSSLPPVSYSVDVLLGSYTPQVGPAPWVPVQGASFKVYAADSPSVEEQAVLISQTGLCRVQRNEGPIRSQFIIDTTEYDDVTVVFRHDCYYPRIRIGQPPASDDVIEYSRTAIPKLTPDASVKLSVAANTGEELQLDMRVVDTEEGQWKRGQNFAYSVQLSLASNDVLRNTTIITPEVDTPQLTNITSTLNELTPARITVASTCSDEASSGYIELSINFNFSRPITLPINITCQPQKTVTPLRSLSVDLLPGAQYVGAPVSRLPIAVNGSVAADSVFNVASGEPYMFAIPQRYVQLSLYNNNYLSTNRSITGRLTVSAGDWLVGLSANSAASIPAAQNSFTFSLQSRPLTVQLETQCETSNQLQTTTVVINSISDEVVSFYDPIEFTYQWQCLQPPLFALSTQSPSSAQAVGNLINRGQPANTAGGSWTVDRNGTADVINVNYNIQAEMDSLIGATLYLTLQTDSATVFAWSLEPATSDGLSDVAFRMLDTPVTAGSTYRKNLPLSTATQLTTPLSLDRLLCSKREYVQVSTRITYGWTQHVTLNFNRRCTQADTFDSAALSSGAVAAIVLTVLATACCLMGCGWRYSSKGKRGWEMMPCYDWWGAVQDSALGPKRYTGPQMDEDGLDLDGTTEEVEISSVGGYGSTSYQNDL